jgi:hypothetical protein
LQPNRSRSLVFSLAIAIAAMLAAPAFAAAYETHITQPATSPSYLSNDRDSATTFHVAGTSDLPGSATVDVRCYYADTSAEVQPGVDVQSDGSFSTDADLGPIDYLTCILRAVQTGDSSPADVSNKTGPTMASAGFARYRTAGGRLEDYFEDVSGLKGYADFYSAGDCGLDYAAPYTSDFTSENGVFDCNAYFAPYDNVSRAAFSLLRVDGENAYLPYHFEGDQLDFVDATNDHTSDKGNAPTLTVDRSRDLVTGDLSLAEESGLGTCRDSSYPPTSSKCDSLRLLPVHLSRQIHVDHDGAQVVMADIWTSTDGRAHDLIGIYENDQYSDPSEIGYQFPGQTGYSHHADQDEITPWSSAPDSILLEKNTDPAPGELNGLGALTMNTAPQRVYFFDDRRFGLQYEKVVPASGALVIEHVYSSSYSDAELSALRADAEDRVGAPIVAIASPASGSTVPDATVTARGTAVDPRGGVVALRVNGAPVPVAADGTWSAKVALKVGANTIAAQATDRFGNAVTATAAVTRAGIPALTKLGMTPRKFAISKKRTPKAGVAAKVRKGAKISYTVTQDASVTFTISRQTKGRRSGKKCRRATRKLRGHRRCTILKRSGTLRRTAKAGAHRLAFSGRIGRKALRRGRYVLTVTAANASGLKSTPRSVRFRIVKG